MFDVNFTIPKIISLKKTVLLQRSTENNEIKCLTQLLENIKKCLKGFQLFIYKTH